MNAQMNKLIIESVPNQEKSNALIGRLFDVAQPSAIFSPPVSSGPYTVITASEVIIGMGAGYGGGASIEAAEGDETASESGYGGGGGGGGSAFGRPVAAIIIEPNRVRVEPIIDPTKIALALFATLLSMLVTVRKARKAA